MFTCFAVSTHDVLVPMAWALRTAGHEVRVVSQPELVETITQYGLTAVRAGSPGWAANDPLAPELLELIYHEDTSQVQYFDFTGRSQQQWTWDHLLVIEHLMVAALHATLKSQSIIDESVAFARNWQPDLVIAETFTFAGAVAARACGAAHARMVWGPDIALRVRRTFIEQAQNQVPEHRKAPTEEWLGHALERYMCPFNEEIVTGQWTIGSTPPSGRLDLGLHTVGARYVPYNGPALVADLVYKEPERPRVRLTFGIIEREASRSVASLREMSDAAAELDAEFIPTLDATELDPAVKAPGNIHLVDFVPSNDLLLVCRAIVHEGGPAPGPLPRCTGCRSSCSLTDGTPEVKAEHITRVEAGAVVAMFQLNATEFRDTTALLLSDPSFRHGAQRLREEIPAEPSPTTSCHLSRN